MRRPPLHELLSADPSKMSLEELRVYQAHLKAWQTKDSFQMLKDESEGKPEYQGFIYILSHEAMPGLLKIGFTEGKVEKRAAEIARGTGVPGPFKIESKIPIYESPKESEKRVHRALDAFRAIENREFFRLSAEDAERFVRAALDGRFQGL